MKASRPSSARWPLVEDASCARAAPPQSSLPHASDALSILPRSSRFPFAAPLLSPAAPPRPSVSPLGLYSTRHPHPSSSPRPYSPSSVPHSATSILRSTSNSIPAPSPRFSRRYLDSPAATSLRPLYAGTPSTPAPTRPGATRHDTLLTRASQARWDTNEKLKKLRREEEEKEAMWGWAPRPLSTDPLPVLCTTWVLLARQKISLEDP